MVSSADEATSNKRGQSVKYLVLLLLLTVAACNDSSGSAGDNNNNGGSNGSSSDQNVTSAAGIWSGNYEVNDQDVYDMYCLVSKAQEMACRLVDSRTNEFAGVAHIEKLSFSNGNFSGQGVAFAAPGYQLGSTFKVSSGVVKKQATLKADAAIGTKQGMIDLDFDSEYERDSSLQKVAAVYSDVDLNGAKGTLVVRDDGTLNIQSAASTCKAHGQVSILDSGHDIYDVSLTMENCTNANGQYSGLGSLTDSNDNTKNDVFVLMVFNESAGSPRNITVVATK